MSDGMNTNGVDEAVSILKALDEMADAAPPEGVTLRGMFDQLDDRAFGAMIFALAIPCCIPLLWGIPQIVALPMLFLIGQMILGRDEPWLPERFAQRQIDKNGLTRISNGARRYFGWAEKIAVPRLTGLTHPVPLRVIALFMFVFSASILLPIPGTNTVPGMGVALIAFGLMARDGLLMIGGLILGSAWITMLVTIGTTALKAIIKGVIGG